MNLLKQIWTLTKMARRAGGMRGILNIVRTTPRQVRLVTNLLKDARVALPVKVVFVAALVYAVSPLNFIPWYMPIIGPLDDLGIALLAFRFLLSRVPQEILADHKHQVGLSDGRVRVANTARK